MSISAPSNRTHRAVPTPHAAPPDDALPDDALPDAPAADAATPETHAGLKPALTMATMLAAREQQLCEALREVGDLLTESPSFLAELMVAGLHDGELDLRDLRRGSGRQAFAGARMLAALPPAGWDALQQYSLLASGRGITSVRLPDTAGILYHKPGDAHRPFAPLLQRLKDLPHLRKLELPSAYDDGNVIDLQSLGAPVEIAIRGLTDAFNGRVYPVFPCEIRAAAGARVLAVPGSFAFTKSTVVRYDDSGQRVGGARSLACLVHDTSSAQGYRDLELEEVFAPSYASGIRGFEKVCRDKALHWLRCLQAREEDKTPKSEFYKDFRSEAGLGRRIPWDTTLEYLLYRRTNAKELFTVAAFGTNIARAFGTIQPGQSRKLFINTGWHVMPLALEGKQHEGEPDEFVVRFYDDNFPALHTRAAVPDPALLAARPLSDWSRDEHGLPNSGAMDAYFDNIGVGAIHAWSPTPPQPGRTQRSPQEVEQLLAAVPQETRDAPEFLFWAMYEGLEGEVRKFLDRELAGAETLDDAACKRLQAWSPGRYSRPALHHAVLNGCTPAVDLFVDTILSPRVTSLTQKQRFNLVGIQLGAMFDLAAPAQAVAAWTRGVASAPDDVLTRRQRIALLVASEQESDASDRPPMLYRLAGSNWFKIGHPGLASEQHELVVTYLGEIARSPLTLPEKTALFAARHGQGADSRTAAQAALDSGNPRAAAAMVSAVLESARDPALRSALLDALDVDVADVLWALQRSGSLADALWIPRLEGLMERAGMPPVARLAPEETATRWNAGQASAAEALCDEIQKMIPPAWCPPERTRMVAAEATDAILRCVRGGDVDFGGLDNAAHTGLVADMPAAAWDALERFVVAGSRQGIASVALHGTVSLLYGPPGADTRPLASLLAGLKRLPGLQRLAVPAPCEAGDCADFARLQAVGALARIEVREGEFRGPYEVRVPAGAEVMAAPGAKGAVKCTVVEIDQWGRAGEPRTLGLLAYPGKPPTGMTPLEASQVRIDAYFRNAGNLRDATIRPQHIAMQWMADREAARAGGEPQEGPFYDRYATSAAVAQHVQPDTDAQFRRMRAAGAEAGVPITAFGDVFAREFEALPVGGATQLLMEFPGTARDADVLVFDLRRKDSECVLVSYDPRHPAGHSRQTFAHPGQMRGLGIEALTGLAGQRKPPVASLFRGDARAPVQHAAAAAAQATGPDASAWFNWYFHEARAADVERSIAAILDDARLTPAQRFDALRTAQDPSALMLTLASSGTRAIAASQTQWTSPTPLTQSTQPAAAGAQQPPAFDVPGTFEAFARRVASAPDDVLAPAQRLALLRGADPSQSWDTPLLHLLPPVDAAPESMHAYEEAVFRYLAAIVASPLPIEDKKNVCRSEVRGMTAAAAALRGSAYEPPNPTLAAAMLAAAMQAGGEQRAELIDAMGVDAKDVEAALKTCGLPTAPGWLERIAPAPAPDWQRV